MKDNEFVHDASPTYWFLAQYRRKCQCYYNTQCQGQDNISNIYYEIVFLI